MLSRIFPVVDKPNFLSAVRERHERAEALSEQQEIDALSKIATLELQEDDARRKIEILSIKIGILEDIQQDPHRFNKEQMHEDYLERLKFLEMDLIGNQRVALKSRYGAFKQEKFVKLTPQNQNEFLEEFRQKLTQELQPHRRFFLNSLEELEDDLRILREEEAGLKRMVDFILGYRARLQDEFFDRAVKTAEQASNSLAADHEMVIESEQNQFFAACKEGDLDKVISFVESKKGMDRVIFVRQSNEQGQCALHIASFFNNASVVDYLLNHSGDPNQEDQSGCTAIHYASINATYDTLEALQRKAPNLLAVDKKGRNGLYLACFHANWGSINWFLLNKLPIDSHATKEYARTSLHVAAFRGHTRVVRFLLKRGANPRALNIQKETPLFEALYAGHIQTAKAFLAEGIWLNHQDQYKLFYDRVRGGFFWDMLSTILQEEQQRILPTVKATSDSEATAEKKHDSEASATQRLMELPDNPNDGLAHLDKLARSMNKVKTAISRNGLESDLPIQTLSLSNTSASSSSLIFTPSPVVHASSASSTSNVTSSHHASGKVAQLQATLISKGAFAGIGTGH